MRHSTGVFTSNLGDSGIMNRDTIFARTTAGEREKANLPDNLKRVLSLINGRSTSGDLAKRAPPSLRTSWDELLGELVRGGYITDSDEAAPDEESGSLDFASAWTPQSHNGSSYPQRSPQPAAQPEVESKEAKAAKLKGYFAAAREKAKAEAQQAALDMAEARAKLEAAAAAAKRGADAAARAAVNAKQRKEDDVRAHAALEAAIAAAKNRSNAEANALADARRRDELAARTRAEREAAIASAKARSNITAKAQAEAKRQAEKEARAHAELEAAVAAAKARTALLAQAQAKAEAEARQRDEEAKRAHAELEAAIKAAKIKSDAVAKSGFDVRQDAEPGMPRADIARLRSLEIENETLKRMLSEAYLEIAALKKRSWA